jgi:hypothetical protein
MVEISRECAEYLDLLLDQHCTAIRGTEDYMEALSHVLEMMHALGEDTAGNRV